MPNHIEKSTFKFLNELKKNNNREWFQANKNQYDLAHTNVLDFADDINAQMSKSDQIVQVSAKKMLFRIYRDVRFSKDKTPYKTGFMGGLKRDTKWLRGGYFFAIKPGNESVIAGGFWNPNSQDIKRIRKEIEMDSSPMRKLIKAKSFKSHFGELTGDEVKTAPKGYNKEHPDIDLIRKKQFLLIKKFSDKEVLSPEFSADVISTFKAMRPFFDYMSEVLTTDENGVPIV